MTGFSRPEDTGRAPARAAGAVTLEFDGEAVIYHLQTGEVHRLDRVGSIVWQFVDGQTTVDELVPDLAGAFGVEPGEVRGNVEDLLARLADASLLAGGRVPSPRSGPVLLTNPPSP